MLLDPLDLDKPEEMFLQCEKCGMEFSSEQDEDDYTNIEETGLCVFCNNN